METTGWCFEVARADLAPHPPSAHPRASPAEGEVRVEIEHLALSANTMTYGAMGHELGYWSLFPAAQAAHGCIPAWGHARVSASRVEGIAEGSRLFGLFPMATHCVLRGQRSRLGLRETSEWRQGVNPVYNQYLLRPEESAEAAELRAVFHPLFVTSFVLGEHLGSRHADRELVFVSASSKTALGTAFGAHRRQRCIGLTSARNVAWLRDLGCHAAVGAYDEPAVLGGQRPALVIDFSGDAALTERIGRSLGERWAGTLRVGATHTGALAVPAPEDDATHTFSGPETIGRLVREWGPAEFDRRLEDALQAFVGHMRPHARIRHVDGPAALVEAYRGLLAGRSRPDELLVARPNGAPS